MLAGVLDCQPSKMQYKDALLRPDARRPADERGLTRSGSMYSGARPSDERQSIRFPQNRVVSVGIEGAQDQSDDTNDM
jgi:hypothetical protein